MRCDSCGYDNLPEARFCANCGSSLPLAAKQPAIMAVPGIEPAATKAAAAKYAGFWIRFLAAIIDTIILNIVMIPISATGGFGFMFAPFWIFLPWLYYWLFTGLKGQTPGKMALGITVINSEGTVPGLSTAALREIPGKIISSIVIFLGFFWIAWDGQKQGWHDKIAKTYVIRVK